MNDSQVPNRARQIALHQIRQLMDFWRISAAELLAPPAAAAPLPAGPRPAKYRHPVSGDTWDGQGEQPDWLRRALTVEGYRVVELRVAPEAAAAAAP